MSDPYESALAAKCRGAAEAFLEVGREDLARRSRSSSVDWVLIEPQTNSWLQRRHVFLLDVVRSGLGLA